MRQHVADPVGALLAAVRRGGPGITDARVALAKAALPSTRPSAALAGIRGAFQGLCDAAEIAVDERDRFAVMLSVADSLAPGAADRALAPEPEHEVTSPDDAEPDDDGGAAAADDDE